MGDGDVEFRSLDTVHFRWTTQGCIREQDTDASDHDGGFNHRCSSLAPGFENWPWWGFVGEVFGEFESSNDKNEGVEQYMFGLRAKQKVPIFWLLFKAFDIDAWPLKGFNVGPFVELGGGAGNFHASEGLAPEGGDNFLGRVGAFVSIGGVTDGGIGVEVYAGGSFGRSFVQDYNETTWPLGGITFILGPSAPPPPPPPPKERIVYKEVERPCPECPKPEPPPPPPPQVPPKQERVYPLPLSIMFENDNQDIKFGPQDWAELRGQKFNGRTVKRLAANAELDAILRYMRLHPQAKFAYITVSNNTDGMGPLADKRRSIGRFWSIYQYLTLEKRASGRERDPDRHAFLRSVRNHRRVNPSFEGLDKPRDCGIDALGPYCNYQAQNAGSETLSIGGTIVSSVEFEAEGIRKTERFFIDPARICWHGAYTASELRNDPELLKGIEAALPSGTKLGRDSFPSYRAAYFFYYKDGQCPTSIPQGTIEFSDRKPTDRNDVY
jgi:hypothetical protein